MGYSSMSGRLRAGMAKSTNVKGAPLSDPTLELTELSTLTEWEWVGLQKVWNLADGHSHFSLEQADESPIGQMARTFRSINSRSQTTYERNFIKAFFEMSRQSIPSLKPLLHYSCSTTIDLVAKA